MRPRYGLTATLVLSLVAGAGMFTPPPSAQVRLPPEVPVQTVSPFDIIGFITAATVDDPADDVFSGGTITLNGKVVIVPRNTFLQFPAHGSTWQEVFANAPAEYRAHNQSGLAQKDTDANGAAPRVTYEVQVQGNRVIDATGDRYIAGLMFLAQQALNNGAGFINAIDYATGEMRVGGVIGNAATGARVRINDPLGRLGIANSLRPGGAVDDRFTVDEDNPTVRSETGYPMCVPRKAPVRAGGVLDPASVDPLCPAFNRPRGADGNPLTIFTMDPPAWPGGPVTVTNPYLMAPFEVGDYIDYSGNLTSDAQGDYVMAWAIIANAGIFTAPGTQPAYVAVDTVKLGVAGTPVPFLPQEAAVRTRMEGFTTDPSNAVDLFAIDVDPCTAVESLRYYATISVDQGPPSGAVRGRWRWRPSTELAFLPPSRELIAVSETGVITDPDTGAPTVTPNGLMAGQYRLPNFEFLFPENLGIGNPPVPANFQDFPFLVNGSGPYNGGGALGQLKPWPGVAAPVAICAAPGTITAPVANAGATQFVTPGTVVTLDASGSHDTNSPAKPLTYEWRQLLPPFVGAGTGPAVLLSFVTTEPTATFTAPALDALNTPQTLKFRVTVSNGSLSSSSVVSVKNGSPAPGFDTVVITAAVFTLRRSQLSVVATSTDPNATLTVVGFGDMGPGLPLVVGGAPPPGLFSYRQVGVTPQPTTVTVVSSSGGTSVPAVVVVK